MKSKPAAVATATRDRESRRSPLVPPRLGIGKAQLLLQAEREADRVVERAAAGPPIA